MSNSELNNGVSENDNDEDDEDGQNGDNSQRYSDFSMDSFESDMLGSSRMGSISGDNSSLHSSTSSVQNRQDNDHGRSIDDGSQISARTGGWDNSQQSSNRWRSSTGSSSSSINAAMKRASIRDRSRSNSSLTSKDSTALNQTERPGPFRFGQNNSAQQNLDTYIANSRRGISSSTYFKKVTVNEEETRARQSSTTEQLFDESGKTKVVQYIWP